VQKRSRALVLFDESRIHLAIMRAAESVGGLQQDYLAGVNDKLFDAYAFDEKVAEFLAETVVLCLNSDPHHLIANFPPTIEEIQDKVVHTLRSYGFQNTADAYECYRWGRHWLREGAITEEQFAATVSVKQLAKIEERNRQARLRTRWRGLTKSFAAAASSPWSMIRWRLTNLPWTKLPANCWHG